MNKISLDLKPGDLLYYKFRENSTISSYDKEHLDFIIKIEKDMYSTNSTNFFIYSTLSNTYSSIGSDIIDHWLNTGTSNYKSAIIIRP